MVDWNHVVRTRLANLRLTATAESELTEELAQHLEDLHRELLSGGATVEDAYREALSELDDIYALGAGVDGSQRMSKLEPVPAGDPMSRTLLNDLLRDLRYAGRALRSNPLFVLIVVATLGLGIGANSTVFTVLNAVILSPLPVDAPAELLAVAAVASTGWTQGTALLPVSHSNFTDYQTENSVFSGLAGYTRKRALTWEAQGGSQPLLSEFVTANYFQVLGVGRSEERREGKGGVCRNV